VTVEDKRRPDIFREALKCGAEPMPQFYLGLDLRPDEQLLSLVNLLSRG
jgi:hypothetical protein